MSARPITLVLGTAAGAFLAAGLTSMATLPVAHADDGADLLATSLSADPAAFLTAADPAAVTLPDGFVSSTDPLLAMLGITDIGAANPGENFEAMILEIPSLNITDVLTSGAETTNDLAQFGVPADIGLGMAGVSVNTFIDTMTSTDTTTVIPFTDPLAGLWDILVMNDFFGL
jgi:hypothetical protein